MYMGGREGGQPGHWEIRSIPDPRREQGPDPLQHRPIGHGWIGNRLGDYLGGLSTKEKNSGLGGRDAPPSSGGASNYLGVGSRKSAFPTHYRQHGRLPHASWGGGHGVGGGRSYRSQRGCGQQN